MRRETLARMFCLSLLVGLGCADVLWAQVAYRLDGNLITVNRTFPADTLSENPFAFSVEALLAGPSQAESAFGIYSAIPAGVSAQHIELQDGVLWIELSEEAIDGLDLEGLEKMEVQFWATLLPLAEIDRLQLTCGGRTLASYLEASPVLERFRNPDRLSNTRAESEGFSSALLGSALTGRSITLGPSHGRYWAGTLWGWQRSDPCGLGQAVLEDTNSIRLMQFLKQYLVQDGAVVNSVRELDETNCCNSSEGRAWWQMASYSWLREIGAPCSVWASSTGNCSSEQGPNRYSDDIRCRPLYADYVSSDLFIAHHTNAGGGGTASGTEVYRDSAMEHPQHEANSYDLALKTKTEIEAAIRDMYDPTWPMRNNGFPRDSAGGFGEIRIPDQPACLVELAFHDNCSKDAPYLTDPFFRSVTMWGLYAGVCDYFGVVPTWDRYSYEVVSHTFPSTMEPNETVNVEVTLRNRGVLWRTSDGFRLGAEGDSDPFAVFNRVDVVGEIRPGEEVTFSFVLTAPALPNTYTTQWQMVRDGYAWFGPLVSQAITVAPTAPLGDFDEDGDVDLDDYAHLQVCFSGSAVAQTVPACDDAKFDGDSDVDESDLTLFLNCLSGADVPAQAGCQNP